MQSRLKVNREYLHEEGVDFINLWARRRAENQYRKRLAKILNKEVVDERKILRLSRQLHDIVAMEETASNSLVVLSFENILGSFDLTRNPVPYPHAAAVIRHIAEAFSDHRIRIFLAIRSLDRFLESGYVQRVTTRRVTRSFELYLCVIDVPALSWLPLVRAVESVVGSEDTILWAYERFFSDEPAIWNALLNRPDAEAILINPARRSNHSLSARGLTVMRGVNKVGTPKVAKKLRKFIKRHFSDGTGSNSPNLLCDASRLQLIENYERDLKELAG
jgi:hypothetical protein